MDLRKSRKLFELVSQLRLEIAQALLILREAEKNVEALRKSIEQKEKELYSVLTSLLPVEEEASERPQTEKKGPQPAKTSAQYEYEYKGVPDYANHLVLKTTEDLAKELTFEQLCQVVDQQKIMPTRWGKLKLYAKESDVYSLRKDPHRRYFMKHPITSKDGVKFYVTTQWATKEWNKDKTAEVPGSFERYREAVAKAGIIINRLEQAN